MQHLEQKIKNVFHIKSSDNRATTKYIEVYHGTVIERSDIV